MSKEIPVTDNEMSTNSAETAQEIREIRIVSPTNKSKMQTLTIPFPTISETINEINDDYFSKDEPSPPFESKYTKLCAKILTNDITSFSCATGQSQAIAERLLYLVTYLKINEQSLQFYRSYLFDNLHLSPDTRYLGSLPYLIKPVLFGTIISWLKSTMCVGKGMSFYSNDDDTIAESYYKLVALATGCNYEKLSQKVSAFMKELEFEKDDTYPILIEQWPRSNDFVNSTSEEIDLDLVTRSCWLVSQIGFVEHLHNNSNLFVNLPNRINRHYERTETDNPSVVAYIAKETAKLQTGTKREGFIPKEYGNTKSTKVKATKKTLTTYNIDTNEIQIIKILTKDTCYLSQENISLDLKYYTTKRNDESSVRIYDMITEQLVYHLEYEHLQVHCSTWTPIGCMIVHNDEPYIYDERTKTQWYDGLAYKLSIISVDGAGLWNRTEHKLPVPDPIVRIYDLEDENKYEGQLARVFSEQELAEKMRMEKEDEPFDTDAHSVEYSHKHGMVMFSVDKYTIVYRLIQETSTDSSTGQGKYVVVTYFVRDYDYEEEYIFSRCGNYLIHFKKVDTKNVNKPKKATIYSCSLSVYKIKGNELPISHTSYDSCSHSETTCQKDLHKYKPTNLVTSLTTPAVPIFVIDDLPVADILIVDDLLSWKIYKYYQQQLPAKDQVVQN